MTTGPDNSTVPPPRVHRRKDRIVLWIVIILVGLWALGRLVDQATVPATREDAQALDRANTLRAIVRSSGEPCDHVIQVYDQGILGASGDRMWNVRCRDGQGFAIKITRDGKASVIDCTVLLTLTKVDCFRPLK